MKTLLFTIVLLMALAIVTSARMARALDRQTIDIAILGSARADLQAKNDLQDTLFDYFSHTRAPRSKTGTTPPRIREGKRGTGTQYLSPIKFNVLPPNALLDMRTVLGESGNAQVVFQEVFKRLIFLLYGDHPFFKGVPDLANRLAAAVIEGYGQTGTDAPLLSSSEDLGKIILADPSLQPYWYAMLRGAESLFVGDPKEYPSLLDYVFVYKSPNSRVKSNQKTINVLHAPIELLVAFFDSQSVAEGVVILREEFITETMVTLQELQQKIDNGEKLSDEERVTQDKIKKLLQVRVEDLIAAQAPLSKEYADALDYSLGASAVTLTGRGGDRRSGIINTLTIPTPPLVTSR